jgi:hypothetical protein
MFMVVVSPFPHALVIPGTDVLPGSCVFWLRVHDE